MRLTGECISPVRNTSRSGLRGCVICTSSVEPSGTEALQDLLLHQASYEARMRDNVQTELSSTPAGYLLSKTYH